MGEVVARPAAAQRHVYLPGRERSVAKVHVDPLQGLALALVDRDGPGREQGELAVSPDNLRDKGKNTMDPETKAEFKNLREKVCKDGGKTLRRAADVPAWLGKAIEKRGASEYLRSDNGPDFIAKEVQRWLADNHIKTIYIDPGSPWQNGFVESFHGRFRDKRLNREQLWTLTEARVVIEDFLCEYNYYRPHSNLGYISPSRFAAR